MQMKLGCRILRRMKGNIISMEPSVIENGGKEVSGGKVKYITKLGNN